MNIRKEREKRDWTEIPGGTLKGAEQRLWGEVGDNAGYFAQEVNTNPVFLKKIGHLINNELDPVHDSPIFGMNKFGQGSITVKIHRSPGGEECIKRITSLGGRVSSSAGFTLMSCEYREEGTYEKYGPAYFTMAIVRGMEGKTAGQIWKSFKSNYDRPLPNTRAEIACILMSAIPQVQWKKWGIETVIIFHLDVSSFINPSRQRFLSIDVPKNELTSHDGFQDYIMVKKDNVAFVILESVDKREEDVL